MIVSDDSSDADDDATEVHALQFKKKQKKNEKEQKQKSAAACPIMPESRLKGHLTINTVVGNQPKLALNGCLIKIRMTTQQRFKKFNKIDICKNCTSFCKKPHLKEKIHGSFQQPRCTFPAAT